MVGYHFEGDFDELALQRALDGAQAVGVVTQWGSGRSDAGVFVWLNGPPGEELRQLREEVRALADSRVPCSCEDCR